MKINSKSLKNAIKNAKESEKKEVNDVVINNPPEYPPVGDTDDAGVSNPSDDNHQPQQQQQQQQQQPQQTEIKGVIFNIDPEAEKYAENTQASQKVAEVSKEANEAAATLIISLYEGTLTTVCKLINKEYNVELDNKKELVQLLQAAYPNVAGLSPKALFWVGIIGTTAAHIGAAKMTKK